MKPKQQKIKRKIEIIESPRQFETVGEAVRFEIMEEIQGLIAIEIAEACVTKEPVFRLIRVYGKITDLLK